MFGKSQKSTMAMVHGEGASEAPKPEKKKKEKVRKTVAEKEYRSGKSLLRNKTLWGGLCILVALLIGFVATPLAQQRAADLTPVVVLTKDADVRTSLTSDMLEVQPRAANGIPADAIMAINDALGKYVAREGLTGDILTTARLTDHYPTDDPELLELPEGKVAMAVALDSLEQSVASKLRAGDIVQLFAVLDNTANTVEKETVTAALIVPELQAVEVLSVTNSGGEAVLDRAEGGVATDAEGDRQIATVVLAVNQEQASTLAGLAANAKLHAALVLRGDDNAKSAILAEQDSYFLALKEPDGEKQDVENERTKENSAAEESDVE